MRRATSLYTREATARTKPMPPERKIPFIPARQGKPFRQGAEPPLRKRFKGRDALRKHAGGMFLAKAGSGLSPWPGEDKHPPMPLNRRRVLNNYLKPIPPARLTLRPALYTREATTRTQPTPLERKIHPNLSASGEALSAGGRAPFEEAF